MKRLENKVAVVTGASKGIGAEIARRLASEGASVVVNYASSKAGADQVVKEIEDNGGKAVAIQADVSKKADIVKLFADAKKAFGKIDILVNNAGMYKWLPLEEITEEHFHEQFNLNVLGLLLTTQEAVKHFDTAGGAIVNISSVVSTFAPPGAAVYSATKGAVDTLTKCLAKELGTRKIRVNSVNPGAVKTEGTEAFEDPEFFKRIEAMTPLGRIGNPHDIAPVVAYLASDEASWVTGETWVCSGGLR
jgi:3-oxoacyl-[acyl-carrier protein] reductase